MDADSCCPLDLMVSHWREVGEGESLLPWSLRAVWRDQQPAAAQRVVAPVRDVVEDCVWHSCDGVVLFLQREERERRKRDERLYIFSQGVNLPST